MKILLQITVFLCTALFASLSFSQNDGRTDIPLEFYGKYGMIQKTPEAFKGQYAFLPGPYVNVNISNDAFPQNEPSVKFNAKFPNRVLAAWRDFRTGYNPAQRRIGYSYSTNGGTTWSVSQLIPALDPNRPLASDPVVCSDTSGNFYVCTVSITTAGILELLVFKSTDGGVTFGNYYLAQGNGSNNEDKEWMVCDLTKGSSNFKNHLYITWTRFGTPSGILMTKSTNGGVNWSSPVQVSTGSGVQGSCPAIGPNGELNVVWWGSAGSTSNFYFNKSTNGGTSFGTQKLIASGPTPTVPVSTTGVNLPGLAADVSGGPRNGNLYVTWSDSRNGDPDVFLIRSTNGGDNWSSPVRISTDTAGNGKIQCWPWISVNEQGNIAILFYDSRSSSSTNVIEAWLARSTDGGQTFVNEKLSSSAFTPILPNADVRFGDYINVDYIGSRISTVWTDQRAGGINQEIYTAVIDLSVGAGNISEEIPADFRLFQNYPNPFNPETRIKYGISKISDVKIDIYNITGKRIKTLINERKTPGVYEAVFNGDGAASGIYFYSLYINGINVGVKKMMLVK